MHTSKITAVGRYSVNRFQLRPSRPSRYTLWTIEELRHLACQLQLPDVHSKTRLELLELLAGQPQE